MNVSELSCVSNKALGCCVSYNFICDLKHQRESTAFAVTVVKGDTQEYMTSQNGGQDGCHSSKMATMTS